MVGAILGCTTRPLLDRMAHDGAVIGGGAAGAAGAVTGGGGGVGGGAAGDAGPGSCVPGDLLIGFALCGTLDGRWVSYVPPYLQSWARGNSAVTFEAMGPDGPWLVVWGANEPWRDFDPRDVSGWFFRPPPGWAAAGAWLCGQGGTITHYADQSLDGTLTKPAVLSACSGEGGPDSYRADLPGGIIPFDQGGGCQIGFTSSDFRQLLILAEVCPKPGETLRLDGRRVVTHQRGEAAYGTVCIGPGASLTVVPDPSTSATHLLVDIPSMSLPETCGPPTSGELVMKVPWNERG